MSEEFKDKKIALNSKISRLEGDIHFMRIINLNY